jgi:hypothetical protein
MKAKGVNVKGTLQVGQGKECELFTGIAIAPYGNKSSVDIILSADGRNVCARMDRESALAFAQRIIDELS